MHVHAKAVHAAVEPEAQGVHQRRAHLGVAIVEFGLLPDELVQVILPGRLVESPGGAAEEAQPVVGRAAIGGRVAPDVPVALRILAAAAALDEPGVFVGGVIGDEVNE